MRITAVLMLALSAFACSSDDSKKEEQNGSAEIGSAGGTVTSDDGAAVLVIPPGALDQGQEIRVTALTAAGFDTMVGGTFMAGYQLEPDGLTFNQPATLTRTFSNLATSVGDETTIPLLIAISASGSTRETLPVSNFDIDLDDNSVTFGAEVSHFSSLAVFMPDAIDNENDGLFWSFKVQPIAPAEPKVGEVYNLGLRIATRGIITESVPLYYEDESTGFEFSQGQTPITVGNLGAAAGSLSQTIVPLSTYSCPAVGEARYRARLESEPLYLAVYLASIDLPDCTPAEPCVVANIPFVYRFNLGRDITCIEGDGPDEPLGEPPFSGVVEFIRSDGPSGRDTRLLGTFSAGGADQSAFDDHVLAKRRLYGYADDRGADGTCRVATYADWKAAVLDPYGNPYTFTGKTAGDAASLGFDFVASPVNPMFEAEYDDLYEQYDWTGTISDQPGLMTLAGIPVRIPAAASTPTITLPGYDENVTTNYIQAQLTPDYWLVDTDVTLTWTADSTPGDHLSVWLKTWVAEELEPRVIYECFTQPASQLLVIPASVMQALQPEGEAYDVDIAIFASSRTSATYDGKTLEGFMTRQQVFSDRNYSVGD